MAFTTNNIRITHSNYRKSYYTIDTIPFYILDDRIKDYLRDNDFLQDDYFFENLSIGFSLFTRESVRIHIEEIE